jgi:hypothetical protein
MLTNFISEAAEVVYEPAISMPDRRGPEPTASTAIKVNVRSVPVEPPSTEIYYRAQKIFSRARRTGMMVRAGKIF